jgi:predicted RNA-binding protein Jag
LRQIKSGLAEVFGVEKRVDPFASALQETQEAIREILAGARSVELSPQNSYIRRKQHEMAKEASLLSRSRGKEPRRRVRIYQNEEG